MAYEVYSHNFTIYFWDVYLIVTQKISQLAQPLPYSGKDFKRMENLNGVQIEVK